MLLLEILSKFIFANDSNDEKSNYIFYQIVDINNDQEYVLQCINKRDIFHLKITDIVFDTDILHGLHPVQSCFIGIEYAKHLKKFHDNKNQKSSKHSISRYGKYSISYQDRTGNVCFINTKTNQDFLMDPRDIALSEELIQEFDAAQAFYIGLWAGLKLNNTTNNKKQSHLKLIICNKNL